jgi:DNA polymerase-1
LVFECPKSELEALKHLVKTEMEAAYSLQVPLTVDMGIGHNWLEAH